METGIESLHQERFDYVTVKGTKKHTNLSGLKQQKLFLHITFLSQVSQKSLLIMVIQRFRQTEAASQNILPWLQSQGS